MKIGQKVYTVNNKTNHVDTWRYAGTVTSGGEKRYALNKAGKFMVLPPRCVFETKREALAVAKIRQ